MRRNPKASWYARKLAILQRQRNSQEPYSERWAAYDDNLWAHAARASSDPMVTAAEAERLTQVQRNPERNTITCTSSRWGDINWIVVGPLGEQSQHISLRDAKARLKSLQEGKVAQEAWEAREQAGRENWPRNPSIRHNPTPQTWLMALATVAHKPKELEANLARMAADNDLTAKEKTEILQQVTTWLNPSNPKLSSDLACKVALGSFIALILLSCVGRSQQCQADQLIIQL